MSKKLIEGDSAIRPSKPEDAGAVAPLLVLAMDQIALKFAGTDDPKDAIPLFYSFFQQSDNQYSFVNTLVFENEDGVVGAITGYDGARLHELRKPVLNFLHTKDPDFTLADETSTGECYIDCLAVNPEHQGLGIAKRLINAFCKHADYQGFARVGLIVDNINPDAKKLYEQVGFEVIGEKEFVGHNYFHMVRQTESYR